VICSTLEKIRGIVTGFLVKHPGKRPFWRLVYRCEENIKMVVHSLMELSPS
jgi:hypothetical protein